MLCLCGLRYAINNVDIDLPLSSKQIVVLVCELAHHNQRRYLKFARLPLSRDDRS